MKPNPFDYVRATSVDHAVELLSSAGDARLLAGGQSLMPVLNLRLGAPELVVDISRVDELRSLKLTPNLRIGAAMTQTEVANHPDVNDRWPMLVAAIEQIGHPQIRNRGTVCGSLAHNDPQAELPSVAVALEAIVIARSAQRERSVPADEFFQGTFTTSLEADELMTAVEFPEPMPGQGWSFREFSRQPGDFATAGVAAVLRPDAGRVKSRVVVFGLGNGPTRATLIEDVLSDAAGPDLEQPVVERWAATLDPSDDAHTSARSKVQHAQRLVIEAVAEAWGRMP
jgi:CO/xanthine dehydrogenase FAD-binding subunit